MSTINSNYSPQGDDPSYTEWKNTSARSVDWNSLPPTRKLAWHEVTKTRNAVSKVFLLLAAVTATAAIIIATTPIGLASLAVGAVSLAFLGGGIYLRRMAEHELDPDFRMQKRCLFRQQMYDPNLKTLNVLNTSVAHFLITKAEKQALLHEEIYFLEYDVFVTKHGEKVFGELDQTNMALLRNKFLDYLNRCEITEIKPILQSNANQYFQLTEADLTPFLPKSVEPAKGEAAGKPSGSRFDHLTSKASAFVVPTIKYAADFFIPSALKAAGNYAMASAQHAYNGKMQTSMYLAANAATCVLIHTTKGMLDVLYPEASQVVKHQMNFEKNLNKA